MTSAQAYINIIANWRFYLLAAIYTKIDTIFLVI